MLYTGKIFKKQLFSSSICNQSEDHFLCLEKASSKVLLKTFVFWSASPINLLRTVFGSLLLYLIEIMVLIFCRGSFVSCFYLNLN